MTQCFKKLLLLLLLIIATTGCGGGGESATTNQPPNEPAPIANPEPEPTEPVIEVLPIVNQVNVLTTTLKTYTKIELSLDITAEYSNPYNQEEIAINAVFTSPSNKSFIVPAFWDGESNWLIRFTPYMEGRWNYELSLSDIKGNSSVTKGEFEVAPSTRNGWLQTGTQVDPNYSNKYLVHHNGTPFYGVGHADAFIVERSFSRSVDDNLEQLITNMKEADENYFVWWPQFYFSLVEHNYDDFDRQNLNTIDAFLEQLEQENLFVIFTLWDHSQLRDNNHPWLEGNWFSNNSFSDLTSLSDFFIDDEAWLWQRNLYRYIIARFGYSASIAMWQTVSEIDGTNAFEQTEQWHKQVNDYFVNNDPYQHPTTASKAGDIVWSEGHQVMDVAQVHIYQDLLGFNNTPLITKAADVIAQYTQTMWSANNKPNWIGEFGAINNPRLNENYYPELFHNAIWAALSNGAALTPAEWNDFFTWGVMTTEMKNHMRFFNTFVGSLPLAQWDPEVIDITDDNTTKSWGILGNQGGLIWTQDRLTEDLAINELRSKKNTRDNITIFLPNITSGQYTVSPFNTWNGEFFNSYIVDCGLVNTNGCQINLPSFISDIAIKLERLN